MIFAYLESLSLFPSLRVCSWSYIFVGIFPLDLVYVGDILLGFILVFMMVKVLSLEEAFVVMIKSSLLRKLLCFLVSSLLRKSLGLL